MSPSTLHHVAITPLGISSLLVLAFFGSASAQSRDLAVQETRQGRQAPAEIFIQFGHRTGVARVAMSPDGRTLASAGGDGIKLWDVATGRELRTLAGLTSVAFAPDGRTVAAPAGKKTVRLWDVATGRELRVFTGHSEDVLSVRFAPDGRTLASAGGDGIRLWDVATGRALRTLAGPPALVFAVAFAPDGRTLASGMYDRTVRLWDVTSGRERRTLAGHSGSVFSLAFAPDGRMLASGSTDKTVKLWDVATGRELRTLAGHFSDVRSLTFAPDGQTLASAASLDHAVKLWQVGTGREIRTLTGSSFITVAFTPDGRTLAAGSGDHAVTLWDVATGRQLRALTGQSFQVRSVAFAPDGRTLATGMENLSVKMLPGKGTATVKLWDTRTGRELRRLGSEYYDSSLAFAPDGRTLAWGTASISGKVKLWDAGTGREVRTLTGHSSRVVSVMFGPDGRTLVSAASLDNDPVLWDVATGRELHALFGHSSSVHAVAFAPHGRIVASGSADRTVKLWDVATGQELRTLTGHSRPVRSVAFAPDGRTLASGSEDDTVRLWDVATGRELRALTGHSGDVLSVVFSPDGRMLASGSGDHTVRLWDASTGRELRTLAAHVLSVGSVAFAADGRTLASASLDTTTRLWDAASGRELVALISFDDGSSLTITPEGYYDASSEQAEENLNVRIGDEVFGISAFRERFYRPDLVKLALTGQSLGQFARLDQVKAAPTVELLDVPATTTHAQVTVKIRLVDTGGGIGDVRLFLNGSSVVQAPSRDVAVTGVAPGAVVRTYSVQVVNGRNELRAVAFNADNSMQSNPAVAEVTAAIKVARPSLHGLVVGIQEFKNPRFNLKYPIADARLFAETVRRLAAPLFQAVEIAVLTTPAETTRDSVVQALQRLRRKVGPEDLFVFFVASHGTVDDGEYFLITSNVGSVSTDRLKTDALSQGNLKDLLGNIPATKKLVVIDTCSAAALGNTLQVAFLTRGLNEETAMKILGRAVGSTVLSASTSTQQALEGYQGHGLLTYVIAEGLSGQADGNRDGFVSTLELAAYVEDEVPAIAERVFHRAQFATVSKSGQGFPLVKVK